MRVLSVGEVLIDLITTEEVFLKDAIRFDKHFGGSVANLVRNIANMGVESSIVACIGKDANGLFLKETLEKEGVDVNCLETITDTHTTVVVVGKSKLSPEFFVMRGADRYIKFTDKVKSEIDKSDVVHFSAFSMCSKLPREEIYNIAKYAKAKNKKISFEPNYRDVLWEGENINEGHEFVENFIKLCDYVKPSLDDCEAIFGVHDEEWYINKFKELGVKNIILTLGKDGFTATDGIENYSYETFADSVVDTTGAGDAFWTGLYLGLSLDKSFKESLLYANAMSAFKVKQVGFSEYPTIKQLEEIIDKNTERR